MLYIIMVVGYNYGNQRRNSITTKTVEIHEAQQQLAELISQVANGTEIILTDGKTPQARLVPVTPKVTQRIPGLHAGNITMSDDFDDPLFTP
ncbi:MAG: type II toxin-antitoxin system prevent-host-death family antitoxin [Chloroflexota bacterium]